METVDKQNAEYWMNEFCLGNEEALSYFFGLHYKSLFYFAVRLIENQQEAEDITAECFVKAWQRHQDMITGSSLKSFLYVTCRNACFNYLKHLKIKSAGQEFYSSQNGQESETVLNQIIKSEVFEILNREIEYLPEKCREIFKLIYFEGKKTDEIAMELNLSVQTVRNQKTKAVDLLKSSMLKKGLSGSVLIAILLLFEGS